MSSLPTDKSTWVLSLLGLLMVIHLGFLGWNYQKSKDSADAFQEAAGTYVTVILALLAPLPKK